jgi:hypothetical protein
MAHSPEDAQKLRTQKRVDSLQHVSDPLRRIRSCSQPPENAAFFAASQLVRLPLEC